MNPFDYFIVFFIAVGFNFVFNQSISTYLSLRYTQYNVIENDRKLYVAKNIAKGLLLCFLSFWSTYPVSNIIMKGEWDTHILRLIAAIYGSMDFVGLFTVPRLAITTIYHHIVTVLLIWSSFFVDFSQPNVSTLFTIYACLSMYAGSFNLYAGLRFLDYYNKLRLFATYNYSLACAINWSLIIYVCINHFMNGYFGLSHIVVLLMFGALVRDDLILIKWLWNDTKHRNRKDNEKDSINNQ